jgi:hypothetical protein
VGGSGIAAISLAGGTVNVIWRGAVALWQLES